MLYNVCIQVGYCQGLPFCVGMLLMHVEEEEAFSLLRFLMFRVGLRRQFHPDMAGLQVTILITTNMCPHYHPLPCAGVPVLHDPAAGGDPPRPLPPPGHAGGGPLAVS